MARAVGLCGITQVCNLVVSKVYPLLGGVLDQWQESDLAAESTWAHNSNFHRERALCILQSRAFSKRRQSFTLAVVFWRRISSKLWVKNSTLKKRVWSNSEAANQPHTNLCSQVMHQSIPPAPSSPPPSPPSPGLRRGIFPPCQSRGRGINLFCKFCTARGPGICQPGAIPELLTRTRFPIRI